MNYVSWAILALVLIWHIYSAYNSASKRNHLSCLIIYLLLNDEIHAAQKKGFLEWIKNAQADDPQQLFLQASEATERLADQLASGDPNKPESSSVLGATGMLWKAKQNEA